jgi:hypothetical protein
MMIKWRLNKKKFKFKSSGGGDDKGTISPGAVDTCLSLSIRIPPAAKKQSGSLTCTYDSGVKILPNSRAETLSPGLYIYIIGARHS